MRTPENKDGSTDALLVCLALTGKQLGLALHIPTMRQGFALDDAGRIPLEAYPDMAHQHGLIAGWVRKRLSDIPSYVLPVLVPLVDGRACVLRAIDGKTAVVWWAESGAQDDRVSLDQLQGLAREEVLIVKLPPKRNDATLAPMQGAAFSWFWGTLWRFRHFYVESMLATVVANVLSLASVFFTMNVYDRVVPTQAYASLWTLAKWRRLAKL